MELGSSADLIWICIKYALLCSHFGQFASVESTFFHASEPPSTSSTSFRCNSSLLVNYSLWAPGRKGYFFVNFKNIGTRLTVELLSLFPVLDQQQVSTGWTEEHPPRSDRSRFINNYCWEDLEPSSDKGLVRLSILRNSATLLRMRLWRNALQHLMW
jgi:hypothetical protein